MGVATPESKVKTYVRNFMKKRFPGIFYYSPPGGQFGKAGIPDHLYLWRGALIAIEIKTDTGRTTQLQEHMIKQLRDQGAIAIVIYGKNQATLDALVVQIEEELVRRGVDISI